MPHSVSRSSTPAESEDVETSQPQPDLPSQQSDEDVPMADEVQSSDEKVKAAVKLDELFADDSEDDEFPSSKPVETPESSQDSDPASSLPTNGMFNAKASDPEVMRSFYQRLFPWYGLFQWLNHSSKPSPDFGHREFAFTIQNDIYVRYLSYRTADLIRKDVLRQMPSRFEIGPVYTIDPRDRKALRNTSSFKPKEKELCFDIDLTDYDDIRTCCDKANICNKCWQFMTMAIKVVDAALREDFGFKHIMWVYSGRRGAHAWVCDKKARTMDDQKRRAVAGYLEVVKGGSQGGKKVNLRRPLHPHLSRSLEILKPHFSEDVLENQDPWRTPEQAEKLLQLLPDRTLVEALRTKWASTGSRSSVSKWADIDATAKSGASKNLDAKALLEAKQDIVLEYTYPRLDIEVSKKLNHLLKSPFVVHPGTGRVCVPIDTRNLEEFDPLGVPTVQKLLQEIDVWAEEHKTETEAQAQAQDEPRVKGVQDWEKTSLKGYIEQFNGFVKTLNKDEEGVKIKRERDGADGMDF